jgi:hypothetical protein
MADLYESCGYEVQYSLDGGSLGGPRLVNLRLGQDRCLKGRCEMVAALTSLSEKLRRSCYTSFEDEMRWWMEVSKLGRPSQQSTNFGASSYDTEISILSALRR